MASTLDEIRSAKHRLEVEIAKALEKFSAETRCPVDSVSIERIIRFSESDAYITQVDIRL
jgi:hypothetical protein